MCVNTTIVNLVYNFLLESVRRALSRKVADYSSILPLVIQNSSEYDPVVNDFIQWCKPSFVDINITKDDCKFWGKILLSTLL